MVTYSIRCRNSKCRHRRGAKVHPDDYVRIPACDCCAQQTGWRVEGRQYSKRNLCYCGGPMNLITGMAFPHKRSHPMCDHHPHGFYNQAKFRGVADEDIPLEYRPIGKGVYLSRRHPVPAESRREAQAVERL